MYRTFLFTFALFLSTTFLSKAQIWVSAEVISGDTMPSIWLKGITISEELPSSERRRILSNHKLVRNIRKVMPYAVACSEKIKSVNDKLEKIEGKGAKKKYLKQAEKELKEDYEDDLKKMTFSQGRLLIKLIDRQCGSSSYELIKLYKSGRSAFFWNSFAGLFGMSLKDEYNPKEEQEIEVVLDYLGYS